MHAQRGDFIAGERQFRASFEGLRDSQYNTFYTIFLSGLAQVLAATDRLDEGLSTAGKAIQRIAHNDGLWWMSEALRIEGEVLLSSNESELQLARQQGALSWELRAAMSLGRLRHAQGRIGDARDLLSTVYAKFTEGFQSADLQAARRLLDQWSVH